MTIRVSLFTAVVAATLVACSSDRITAPPPPPPAGVLLRDVVYDRLPSPYYHFDYDGAGKLSTASFASGAATYSLHYRGDLIDDIDVAAGATERLFYTYDGSGQVVAI